jgi:trimeric autotransporter adhesin
VLITPRVSALLGNFMTVLTATSLFGLVGCEGNDIVPVPSTPAVTSIQITPAHSSAAAGTSTQLSATAIYSDNSHQDVTKRAVWTSSNTTIATISSADASAKAVATGTVTITATYLNQAANATLVITPATLMSLAVTPQSPAIAAGTQQQFTVIGTFSDNSTQDLTTDVTWTSSKPDVASIGAGALVTSLAPGSAAITATCGEISVCGTISNSATLTVSAATLESIEVTPTNSSVALGTTQQFRAIGVFSDHSALDLTSQVVWSSQTPGVATVSHTGANGLLSTVAVGKSQVSASLGGVTSNSAVLTVTAATLTSIGVTPAMTSVAKGISEQFTATGTYSDNSTQDLTSRVTWESSVAQVATISNATGSTGMVNSAGVGSTVVTASMGAISGTASLTVTDATLVSIEVNPTTTALPNGLTQHLTATGIYTDNSTHDITTQVTWSSSVNGVATVSNAAGSNGQVSAARMGSAIISATLGGLTGSTTLNVTAAILESISVTPPLPGVPNGLSQQFTAMGIYSDNSADNITNQVTWSSSATNVATVSNATGNRGLASSFSPGTSVITATLVSAGTSFSASATLTVTAATLVSIAVNPTTTVSVPSGLIQQFTAIGTYTDNTAKDVTAQVTWSSSNTSVASISNAAASKGSAACAGVGTSVITATSGGVSGTSALTVTPAALVSIVVTPTSASVATGLQQQLEATGHYTDGTTLNITAQVTWSSSATDVATVSNVAGTHGLASTVGAGTSTIAATAGSITGNMTLVVTAAELESIFLTWDSSSIAKGTTQQFVLTGTYTDGSIRDVTTRATWSSSVTTVAVISNAPDSVGVATAVGIGTSTIFATFEGQRVGGFLTVTPATLMSIQIMPSNPNIALNATQQFTAMGIFTDQSTQDVTNNVTWFSSNPAVATISNAAGLNGLASVSPTASAGDTSSISAVGSGLSGSTTLTVVAAVGYAYVANRADNTLSEYAIVPGGALTPIGTIGTGNQPVSVAADAGGHHVYVANYADNNVSQYSIGAYGQLIPMSTATVAAGIGPISIAVNPNGQYVYVANFSSNTVSEYDIDAGGLLSPGISAYFNSGGHPRSVLLSANGQHVYVANQADSTISQYHLGSLGELIPMSSPTIAAGLQPYAMALDPDGQNFYVSGVANFISNEFAVGSDGAIGRNTFGFGGYCVPASIAVSSNALYYTCGMVANELIMWSDSNGSLDMSQIHSYAAGSAPAGVTFDPTKHYCYVANAGDQTVSLYSIAVDGSLTPMSPSTVPAGHNSVWITTVPAS